MLFFSQATAAPVALPLAVTTSRCDPLPAPKGTVIKVSSISQLLDAVKKCPKGGIILLANGTYDLGGANLVFKVAGVTLRSSVTVNRDTS